MEFGIGIPTSCESWKVAQRAEELGFTHAWFYDTQMLAGDPFVAMGAAALKTSRIRLGTGVLVPTNRIPAVTASAFATLNAMAPGRGCIFFASDEGQSNLSGVPSSSSARSTSMRTAKPFLSGSRTFSGWIKRVQTSS